MVQPLKGRALHFAFINTFIFQQLAVFDNRGKHNFRCLKTNKYAHHKRQANECLRTYQENPLSNK